jgi:hypothetical protein
MRVRVFVRLEKSEYVKQLVHATCFEPVGVDAAKGVLVFDVAYRMVDVLLDRIAKANVCDFSAHLAPAPK